MKQTNETDPISWAHPYGLPEWASHTTASSLELWYPWEPVVLKCQGIYNI